MTGRHDENNPGTAPGSTHKLAEVLEQMKEVGATVFAIGLGTHVDVQPLQQLADLSGGRALLPSDVNQLGDEFQRVVEELPVVTSSATRLRTVNMTGAGDR